MLRGLLVALALLLSAVSADAAARFIVCTTACTWDAADTSLWSATSGGGTGASVPGAADTVTLDAATCVGGTTCTITVNATITVISITMGACTASTTGCILDFAANDNNVTLVTFSNSGTGTRQLLMGDGTWTITTPTGVPWDQSTITGLTFNSNASTLVIAPSAARTAQAVFTLGASLTYNAITINDFALAGTAGRRPLLMNSASNVITTFTITNGYWIQFAGGATTTITNGFTYNGTSGAPILINSQSNNSSATLSIGGTVTFSWAAFQNIIKAGAGSITATNAYDLGGNTGVTITSPGTARIIGG